MTTSTRIRSGWAALAFLAIASFALAADDSKIIFPGGSGAAARAEAPGTRASGALNSLSLFAGLVLAGVGGWFVWRHRRAAPGGREVRALSISETRSLGNRQYLVVASYEGKKFLLGVCPGRIDMLAPLHESASLEKPRT